MSLQVPVGDRSGERSGSEASLGRSDEVFQRDNADGGLDDEDKSFLQRRNTFSSSGVAVVCHSPSKGDVEPSYYSRERIVFHLGRLLKEFSFFHDMDIEIQAQLPSIVSYAFHGAHSVFFQEGDAGDQCYIVLTGRVDVWKTHAEHNELPSGSGGSPHSFRASVCRTHAEHNEPPSGNEESPHVCRSPSRHRTGDKHSGTGKFGSTAIQRKCTAIAHMLANIGSGGVYCSPTAPGTPVSPRSPKDHHSTKIAAARPSKVAFLDTCGEPTKEGDEVPTDEGHSISKEGEDRQGADNDVNDPQKSWLIEVPEKRFDRDKFMSQESAGSDMLRQQSAMTQQSDMEDGYRPSIRVAALGPGSLFGELALLEDQPRNATLICKNDCEVLTISSVDFNAVLKMHMRKQKSDKISFLRRHVPGFADLPERRIEDYSYLFKPCKFPKSHFFVKQGASSEGLLHFLVKGAVEFRMASMRGVPVFSGLPEVAQRRLGCLATGGMFGSLVPNRYEPFSVVVTTSQCDVYRLSAQDMRRLSDSLLRNLRDVLEHQNSWRINRCDSPAGNILGTVAKTMPNLHKDRKLRPRKMLPVDLRVANELWDMAPGEIIALKGKLPRMLPGSKSAPHLPPALESRPASRMTSAQGSRPASSMSRPANSMSASAIFEQL